MNLSCAIALHGGYKLQDKTVFQGIPVSIENRKGSIRRGADPGGKPWAVKMRVPYGRVPRSEGLDGEAADVFLGPNESAPTAYIVQLMKPPDFKSRDEEKIFLGFNSPDDVKKCMAQHYNSPKFFGGIKALSVAELKDRLKERKGERLAAATPLDRAMLFWGEPSAGAPSYGHAHMEPIPAFHPPSLKNPRRVPVDDPRETDDTYGDVSRRRSAQKFREELAKKKGTDSKYMGIRTTQIGWQPVAVGMGV